MKVGKSRPIPLADRSRYALANDIFNDAELFRMSLSVGGEEVPGATTKLPSEGQRSGKNAREFCGKTGAALLHHGQIGLGSRHSPLFHPSLLHLFHGQDAAARRAASMLTIKMLMSAGLTPLIRLACPSVMGRIEE